MKKGEVVFSALCVACFGFMFYEAIELHGVGRFGEIGSAFWPMLALGVSILLSLGWLISNLVRYFRERGTPREGLTAEAVAEAWDRRRKVGISAACLLLYIIAMPWIGFVLSTFLFIPVFALGLAERRTLVLAISPVLVTGVIVLVFARFITIPLPKGVGIFAAFSRLFY
jgi:putative tricarboxylic transport membrane protein